MDETSVGFENEFIIKPRELSLREFEKLIKVSDFDVIEWGVDPIALSADKCSISFGASSCLTGIINLPDGLYGFHVYEESIPNLISKYREFPAWVGGAFNISSLSTILHPRWQYLFSHLSSENRFFNWLYDPTYRLLFYSGGYLNLSELEL